MLVYDITHRPSFEHALTWLQDVRAHAEETVSVVLVGNMADKCEEEDWEVEAEAEASKAASAEGTETGASASASAPALGAQKIRRRQVSREEAQAFADREGLMFVETSAKTGQVSCVGMSRAHSGPPSPLALAELAHRLIAALPSLLACHPFVSLPTEHRRIILARRKRYPRQIPRGPIRLAFQRPQTSPTGRKTGHCGGRC